MPRGLPDHALRRALTEEVHARPFAHLEAPARATYLALLSGDAGAEGDLAHLAALFRDLGREPPDEGARHAMADFGAFQLKWERHTEFSSYIVFASGASEGGPFAEAAIDALPPAWIEGLPGEVLVALRIELAAAGAPEPSAEALAGFFAVDNFSGSTVAGGAARAWMDFAMGPDGEGRVFIQNKSLGTRQAGRLVQRLCEIETYRMVALLAFPPAQAAVPELDRARERLLDVVRRLSDEETAAEERGLLDELTETAAAVEQVAASTAYRFGASRAYYALVRRRIEELREARIEGYQTVGEFMERRLAPAMRTCESVRERVERLSARIGRTGDLLRTRVDVQLEAQNQELLASMDRRARLQLRLQEAVEGLSVVAISYYLVGLVAYLIKAAKSRGLAIDADLATGISVPVVVLLVWYGIRRARRVIAKRTES